MIEINFDDYFEPEEENEDDFDFIDPLILKQFKQANISIEKIHKDIFNFDAKDDEEIYGEKATRNFEFQIQVSRILQIFDEMIKNIETLLCIQEFVKDRELMEKHFCVNDIEDLCKYCSMKTPELDSLNIDCEEKSFSRLIQLILNSELHLYTENYKDNISIQKKIFLCSIKELRNIINTRLQLTAPKELKKEQILHQMWKKYEKTKEKTETLREKWIFRKENFEEKMKNKYETIERFKKEIEVLRMQNEIEIQGQIKESNCIIVSFCKEKDKTIEEKYLTAEEAKECYQQLLQENLSNEKKLREKKDKAIHAFQVVLKKYDVDVGEERTRELEDLNNALEAQRKEFALWQSTVCEPQIKLHEKLMREKAEIERKEMEQSMMIFMMNRSAKILQKYWRQMVAKRKKKKGRRGKKK